jgi:hypothetical protein
MLKLPSVHLSYKLLPVAIAASPASLPQVLIFFTRLCRGYGEVKPAFALRLPKLMRRQQGYGEVKPAFAGLRRGKKKPASLEAGFYFDFSIR